MQIERRGFLKGMAAALKDDYAYYFTLTYGGKLLIHSILEDVVDDFYKEKAKISRILQFLNE